MSASSTPVPGRLYDTTIRHARAAPLRNAFSYRSHTWLVDLGDLPRLPGPLGLLASFRATDHIGRADCSIRDNLVTFLEANGVSLAHGRVLMLASPRVLGYVFNPITVHWCYDGGDLVAVVVEVHNTYGDRHAYLVHPDADGRATVEKAMYVSPFNEVDGHYTLRVPEPGERVHVAVTLHRPGQPAFVATMTGTGRTATTGAVLRAFLRQPFEPVRVMARIRWQGIRLWARGLPVVPRPHHPAQRGAQ
jgi:DUF1365 family protein